MKKTLFFAVSAILALACSKKLEQTSALPDLETQESAQIEFAKILSKAVYADEDLRVFLKEEAIKQFDNDYDVFYPFVKDETISGGRTFREILVEHAGSCRLCRLSLKSGIITLTLRRTLSRKTGSMIWL